MQQEKIIKIGFNEIYIKKPTQLLITTKIHSSPPSEHMRYANIQNTHHITVIRLCSGLRASSFYSLTHSHIPNLKKNSKETQPTQHSANSQCQSPTSRNDTYQPLAAHHIPFLPTVKVAADQTCPAKPKLAGGPHELWFATLAARAAFATRLSCPQARDRK